MKKIFIYLGVAGLLTIGIMFINNNLDGKADKLDIKCGDSRIECYQNNVAEHIKILINGDEYIFNYGKQNKQVKYSLNNGWATSAAFFKALQRFRFQLVEYYRENEADEMMKLLVNNYPNFKIEMDLFNYN